MIASFEPSDGAPHISSSYLPEVSKPALVRGGSGFLNRILNRGLLRNASPVVRLDLASDVIALPVSDVRTSRLTDTFLLRWRNQPSFGVVETCILALYTMLLAITLPFHEPWADEAQAWLIARDNSFWQIFRYRLHYEGSPPLWHFILRSLHLLHVPWTAIGWCGAVFAIAGVFVWLRWSPLPPLLRWLFPFTFFIQYQYAVVARSYVLFPLLLFSQCALFRSRKARPILFAIVSGLLANLCMLGMVVSVGITLLYCIEYWKDWRPTYFARSNRRAYAALAIVLVFWGVAIDAAMPAPDVAFAIGGQVSTGLAHRILLQLVGETPSNHPGPVTPDYTPAQWSAIMDAAVPPEPDWRTHPGDWVAWEMRSPQSRRAFSDGWNGVLYPLVEIPSELLWPIATLNLVALFFVGTVAVWATRHHGLRFFLPTLALLIVGEFIWIAEHHSGMILISIVAGIWLAATRPDEAAQQNSPIDLAFLGAATLVFLLQVGWSASAIYHDREASYDPSSETAHFLQTEPSGTSIAAFHFWSTGIQPYFNHNPFLNVPSSWWQWCSHITVDGAHKEVLATHPDIVVYTYETPDPEGMRNQIIPLNRVTGYEPVDAILLDLNKNNYRETHRFCGRRFDRWSAAYEVCNLIFERN